jgi:multidrug efflux pump subunit AcrB
LIVLGIVVDDAIIAGENVYSYRERGCSHIEASIRGARDIATPVTFSILTNCVAFIPLLFVPGMMGQFFWPIPVVVITVFVISLVEALFILPAHLSHSGGGRDNFLSRHIHHWQGKFSDWFKGMVDDYFSPFLERCLNFRYLTMAVAFALLIIVVGYAMSDRIAFKLMPEMVSDEARASAQLPAGSSLERGIEVAERLEKAAREVVAKHGGDKLSEGIHTRIRGTSVQVEILLTHPDKRPVSVRQLASYWRKQTGEIWGLETLSFRSALRGPGSRYQDITLELSHSNSSILEQAGENLVEKVDNLVPTRDVSHDFRDGSDQLDITLTPAGRALGFNPDMIGRQVRNSFYGARASRFLRGHNEIDVRVRLPEDRVDSEFQIQNLMLRVPAGGFLPLREAAEIKRGEAYSEINRRNGRRIITIGAGVVPDNRLSVVQNTIRSEIIPALQEKYPDLSWSFGGQQRDIRESANALFVGLLLAMGGIYILLSVPFGSYLQPVVVMMAIPFGVFGAIIGHIILGFSLSIISLMGVVALSGVVVNDSLIMVDYANRHRQGNAAFEAITLAARRRFRPILLTTLTTFGGLAPMIFETSIQARMMIPMAISLGFGILFSTMIILILVPCFYMMVEDLCEIWSSVFG